MRVHITLGDALVRELDRRVGPRGRSPFIARAIQQALDDAHRWELIESATGGLSPEAHEWDADPARWVREQRQADAGRVG